MPELERISTYWDEIPIGKENAVKYADLCEMWGTSERQVRGILHVLSRYDNGDDYILIRSSGCKGFYKTDDRDEIEAYKRECLNRGRNVFAPVKKINRVLHVNGEQFSFSNNLRVIRESRGMKQGDVCKLMKKYEKGFDKSLLSKMENGVCMPTPYQTILLSQIYGVKPVELVDTELYC